MDYAVNPDLPSIDQTLQALAHYRQTGAISDDQISKALGYKAGQPVDPTNRINLQRILYYIGALIIFLGITVYIGQHWLVMDALARCFVTLVPAIAAYSLGYFFHYRVHGKDISQVLFVLAIILFPLGIGTVLNAIGIHATNSAGVSINAALIFLLYFVSSYIFKSELFLPFAIIAGSTLFISVTNVLTNGVVVFKDFQLYRVITLGVTYLALGYYLYGKLKTSIPRVLDFFGLLFSLAAMYILQGWANSGHVSLFWSAVFPGCLIVTYYLSMKLQNRVYLLVATTFTFAEIIKITYEHFANTVGWPLALIIAGCTMIGCGYLSFSLGRKLRQKKPAVLNADQSSLPIQPS